MPAAPRLSFKSLMYPVHFLMLAPAVVTVSAFGYSTYPIKEAMGSMGYSLGRDILLGTQRFEAFDA